MIPKQTRISSYGLIVRDVHILLCRLSAQLKQSQGRWTLPGGGLEFGENPITAMVREVREETGLTVAATQLAGVDSTVMQFPDKHQHAIRILYHTEVLGGALAHETNGSTDRCEWHPIQRVRELPLVELVEAGLGMLG